MKANVKGKTPSGGKKETENAGKGQMEMGMKGGKENGKKAGAGMKKAQKVKKASAGGEEEGKE